jgi:hypothetical protein
MSAEQLASWYSVKEALLEILTELLQGAPEDQICSGLQGPYDMMHRKVHRAVRFLVFSERGMARDHANFGKVYASRRFNTGWPISSRGRNMRASARALRDDEDGPATD